MLFVLLFGVASASASEDVGYSVGAADESAVIDASDSGNNTIAQSDSGGENEVYSSPNTENVLSATDGTFKDLYDKVKNGGTVTLDRSYVYSTSSDSAYVDGITLDKTITIEGNGYTLNGNNAARIFKITASNVVLNNITFINGYVNSEISGAAIYWTGNNGVLKYSNFEHNIVKYTTTSALTGGGAVYMSGINTKISYCNFENNQMLDHSNSKAGGALRIDGIESTLENSYFFNNSCYGGSADGGHLELSGSYNTVKDCTFINGYSQNAGGAIDVMGTNNTIKDSTFINNTAATHGGGAIDMYYADTKVINCKFIGNKVLSGYGGAVDSDNVNAKVSECTFINNTASQYGGGLRIGMGGIVDNCYFENNYAPTGAGVYGRGNLNLTDCSFVLKEGETIDKYIDAASTVSISGTDVYYTIVYIKNNGNGDGLTINSPTNWTNAYEMVSEGGKIIFLADTYTNIINQTISKSISLVGEGNVVIDAQRKGRVFTITAENTTVDNINFKNGYLLRNIGGAIYWTGKNGVLINSDFSNNIVDKYGQEGGGAVYWSGTDGKISYCNFDGNQVNYDSADGPAIFVNGKSIEISYCNFTNNKGTGSFSADAGAISMRSNGGKILHCYFNNNAAPYCGAIYLPTSNVLIANCEFYNNNATGTSGAGVIGLASNNKNITIKDCIFDNNKALNGPGGAILIDSTFKDISIEDCEFINNYAKTTGGAIYNAGNNVSISGSTFSGNNAPNGDAVISTKEITITDSEIENQLSIVVTGNNAGATATLTGTFATGAPSTVTVYLDGTPKATVNVNDKTFRYQFTGLSIGEHVITLKDSNGNSYEFDESGTFTETASTIYVATTEKTGATGLTSTSPVLWSKAIKYINSGGKIIFTAGSYSDVINRLNFTIYWRCF